MNDLPKKAVTRTAKLAALPLGFAGRRALGTAKRLRGAPAEAVLTDVQVRTAEQVFKTLGELKGGAMKFGQALSIMEGALPEELAQPYRAQLTRLQDSAPPMSATTVKHVIAGELGPRWHEHLSIEDEPAASASIGQVHRGTWTDGHRKRRVVAVKVQYPGAEEAIRSDLRQLARLARTLGTFLPGVAVKPLVEELQERVFEELDYKLEAESQRRFAAAYAHDRRYVVPAVVAGSGRVLVTDWLDSPASLARVISDGTTEERNHYGELYARWIFGSPGPTGLLHADPHPGNFRLLPRASGRPGRLGVLDFGAVAHLSDGGLPDYIGRLLTLALAGDYDAATPLFRDAGFIRPGITVSRDALAAYLGPFLEPARTPTYRFSRAFMREQATRLQDPRNEGSNLVFRLNLPPSYLLIHRTFVGTIGVLCQLEADIPFRQILLDTVPGFEV